ncbi:MAG: hypothetical protein GY913_23745 [Proteobacteria bacterium]|nr:hypothetical protein [Pseudomonadota bacterium]MCP4919928.1 hypothetical protein [Pseudomonadota bacterium]
MLIATVALVGVLWALALRHVYAVGRTLNDHFVAAVVSGCMGFYAFHLLLCPGTWPWLAGAVGVWGLFFSIHRLRAPAWMRWVLGWPSQVAYAFALWGGLLWIVRLPFALFFGWDWAWAGWWLVGPLVLSSLGTMQAMRIRETRHVVSGLPGRLVQLSDLHASSLMNHDELGPLVARVNAMEPDVVVVTGDLVMPFSEADHGYLIEQLARIEAPVFCCPGNHDLPVLGVLTVGLREAGIEMLVDSDRELGGFYIAGADFHWEDARARLERGLLELRPPSPDTFRVLLAHDPRLGPWVPVNAFDLVLSGHTHGGQVGSNMLGVRGSMLGLFGVRDQGWFPVGERLRHYVHAGNWFIGLPPRMGINGEIAVFEAPADR